MQKCSFKNTSVQIKTTELFFWSLNLDNIQMKLHRITTKYDVEDRINGLSHHQNMIKNN